MLGSRAYSIAILVLTMLVGGIWWVLTRSDIDEGRAPKSEALRLPTAQTQMLVEAAPGAVRSDGTVIDSGAGPTTTSGDPEDILGLGDPEAALSTELEYIIQRTVDATFDRAKYGVQSITCRGVSCEVRFADLGTSQGSEATAVLRTLYRDLRTASFVNPDTGVELQLKALELRQGSGENAVNAFLLKFENQ